MRIARLAITVLRFASLSSAFCAESKSCLVFLRFSVDETLQINASNFLIGLSTLLDYSLHFKVNYSLSYPPPYTIHCSKSIQEEPMFSYFN